MAPRLAHTKSRSGCDRCKARKVKCDETRPECSKCTQHGASCKYSTQTPARRQPTQRPTKNDCLLSPVISPIFLATPYSDPKEATDLVVTEKRRNLELRLLHHFMTNVTYTFPACNEQRYRDLWTIDAHTDTDQGRDLAKAHRLYLNTAVRQQREAISSLTSSNTDAVFMTSLLLSYQSLRLIPDHSPSATYSPPIQWLKMSKAVATIIEAAGPMVRNGSMMAMMLTFTTEPDVKDEMAMFNPSYRKPFEALLDWNQHPEPDLNLEICNAYEKTLAYVGGVYRALLNKEAPRIMVRRIMCLGVLAPVLYIELLEKGRPRALAILAHHLALSQAIQGHWWFHGVADRVVNGIQSILPADWQWAMAWPLSMIRVAEPRS